MFVKTVYLHLAIATIVMMLIETSSGSEWSQEERDLSLEIHNAFRRNEHGCRMNKLEYDMELEAQAKKWAEHCVFEHETIEGRGENLAWNTLGIPEERLIKHASQAWFDEKNEYQWGQRSCSMSCHYTQLVWGSAEKVGCYSTRCPTLGNTGSLPSNNAWYYVCFYTPQGNWIGEHPYEKTCDTPCQPGQRLEQGLCVGKPTGSGSEGGTGGCLEDDPYSCEIWERYNQCQENPGYMLKYCQKSCRVC